MPRNLSILIGLVVLGAACSGGGSKKANAPTTTSTSTQVSAPVTHASSGSSTTASSPACQTSVLSASLGNPGAAAGTVYYHLLFHNNSSVPCTMTGYPGVSFVDTAGKQIGAPVPRLHQFNGPVLVTPGGSAGALFELHDAYVGTAPNCNSTQAAGLRVYPPNQTVALLIQQTFTVCSNPVTDGTASITEVTAASSLP